MRAVQFRSYGPPQVLQLTETPLPTLQPGDVLVRVHASSVNPHDTVVRSGKLRLITGWKFPLGIGLDFAGKIAATGSEVESWKLGARVWGTVPAMARHALGAAAEYVAVPADRVASTPANLTDIEAAALGVVGTTAYTALHDKAKLKRGERVLIRGAAGGVGSAAVQLAHAQGAHVTALVSARDAAYVRSLGAEVVLDYRLTSPKDLPAFNVIFDTAGTALGSFRRRLSPGGRMITVNFGSGAAMLAIGLSFLYGSRRIRTFSANPTQRELQAIAPFVAEGSLRPDVGDVFSLAAVVAAHTAVETRKKRGKCVLTM